MKNKLTRREMLRTSTMVIGGTCICSKVFGGEDSKSTCCTTPSLEKDALEIGKKSLTIDLTQALSLEGVGDAAIISDEEKEIQIIVVHAKEKEYHALSRFCTHGWQVLSYVRKRGVLQCNNYNHSVFALDGNVVKGPAPAPLTSYPVTLAGQILKIAI